MDIRKLGICVVGRFPKETLIATESLVVRRFCVPKNWIALQMQVLNNQGVPLISCTSGLGIKRVVVRYPLDDKFACAAGLVRFEDGGVEVSNQVMLEASEAEVNEQDCSCSITDEISSLVERLKGRYDISGLCPKHGICVASSYAFGCAWLWSTSGVILVRSSVYVPNRPFGLLLNDVVYVDSFQRNREGVLVTTQARLAAVEREHVTGLAAC